MNTVNDLVAFVDPGLRVRWANRAAADSVGQQPSALIGRHCYQIWHHQQAPCPDCPVQQALWTGTAKEGASESPDGRVWWIKAQPVLDGNGRVVGVLEVTQNITRRERAERRLWKLYRYFSRLGSNHEANIQCLTEACGELLGATAALYNRLEGGVLFAAGRWQTPPDFNPADAPAGHICYDVITNARDGQPFVVRNLPQTPYYQTDPHVAAYGLQTYIGCPVRVNGRAVGSLCAVFQRDVEPEDDDRRLLQILAAAVGLEEERRLTLQTLAQSEARLRQITDHTLDLVLEIDTAGLVRYASPSLRRAGGWEPEALLGRHFGDFVHPDDRDRVRNLFQECLAQAAPAQTECRARHADGRYLWLACAGNPVVGNDGRVAGIVVDCRDVTEQKALRDNLAHLTALLETTFNTLQDAIILQNPDYTTVRCNQAALALFGRRPGEVGGQKCYTLLGRSRPCPACPAPKALAGRQPAQGESFVPELGRHLDCRVAPVVNAAGKADLLVVQLRDITERKRLEDELRRLSLYDSLTGLYNRHYFEQEMRRLQSGRHDPVGIIMCDVDELKMVNDTLGHGHGDQLLRAAAAAVRRCFREEDVVARVGGDELAVLLPRTGPDKLAELVQRLQEAVADHNREHPELPLSISFGAACGHAAREDLQQVFSRADRNMYHYKRKHKRKRKRK